jgi:ElaB/YqjD/DUF883 family membrane-anchored ribosome-binding protein
MMKNRVAESWNRPDDGNESSEGVADQVKEVVQQQLDVVKDQAQEIVEQIEQFIRTRPAAALGIAVAAGVAIGWLIKRR